VTREVVWNMLCGFSCPSLEYGQFYELIAKKCFQSCTDILCKTVRSTVESSTMGIMDVKESIHITNQIRKQNTYSQLLSNGSTVKQLLARSLIYFINPEEGGR
jgi:hypothetical protein